MCSVVVEFTPCTAKKKERKRDDYGFALALSILPLWLRQKLLVPVQSVFTKIFYTALKLKLDAS